MSSRPLPVEPRFWAKVVRGSTPEECWGWAGRARCRPGWHPTISVNGRTEIISRVSWAIHNGPVPDGLWVLHHCDNPDCTNPSHLYLGTPRENVRDMLERGRAVSSNALKTHCKRGHEFTAENTYRDPRQGRRQCVLCRHDVSVARSKAKVLRRPCLTCGATVIGHRRRCVPCASERARIKQHEYGRRYRAKQKAA